MRFLIHPALRDSFGIDRAFLSSKFAMNAGDPSPDLVGIGMTG